ncbi:hypothetical protein F4810DRAFT_705612 [Camillea tinctor]|nr:hypothetical protein F4810DRAFT_705612 [Camillea tinctor]
MTNEPIHDSTTSNVLAWSAQGAHMQNAPEDDAVADVDEPPDERLPAGPSENQFKRSAVRKVADNTESLLTKALHQSEEDTAVFQIRGLPPRRRSLNSSISLASTAELTSDTGFTSPERTNTPSPPSPVIFLARLNMEMFDEKPRIAGLHETSREVGSSTKQVGNDNKSKDPAIEDLPKKRCISFACGPKPETKKPAPQPQAAEPQATTEKPQRRTCIKFACPAKPANQSTSPRREEKPPAAPQPVEAAAKPKPGSPCSVRKYRSPSATRGRSHRSSTPRPFSQGLAAIRSAKYLTANTSDLNSESSHFHEFACDEPREEDWILQNFPATGQRLTINDTLKKENEIRRLAAEAEEEEEQDDIDADVDDDNEEEEEADVQDEHEEDEDDAEDEEDVDDCSGYGSDDDGSDGYNTDNEGGFADSDDDDDDGDLQLWTPGQGPVICLSGDVPLMRRPSLAGNRSSSASSSDAGNDVARPSPERTRRLKIRPGTPELPDSTDFVCGTLDEDRAIEDAYISCIAARRREKLRQIPQDIDPSFPTSEPEDEEIEPHQHAHESDDQLWIHGELEDIHHAKELGVERRKKREAQTSPKRFRSPPPKRHLSPPPKVRGRSPRRLFDRHSPRRLVSPPPSGRGVKSPPASLVHDGNRGNHEFKALAFRPGLTHTKSLPRAPAMFPHHLKGQRRSGKSASTGHVRGAIDIVKGLEKKRQRRKEKFRERYLQKHCNKARKGQIPDKRPQPGKGAERMREIGLLSAGKLGPDQFVLSF